MSAAIPDILSCLPQQGPADKRAGRPVREDIPRRARADLCSRYQSDADPWALVRALRVYYATVVLEAGRQIAPRCDVLAGSGAEQYTALWPDDAGIGAELRRRCGLFAQALVCSGRRDLFRAVYEGIFPAALRHANGEYYTPGWIAELVLDRAGLPDTPSRLLDPSCGSGVFLVRAVRRLKAAGIKSLDSIYGFDVNPLAVLTARVNLLASVGERARTTRKLPNVFLHDCILGSSGWRPFEFVVGNPPWVLWDNLPAAYRRKTAPLWKRYGLFNLPHTQARLGGGKKDLAMLFTYAAADRYLARGGRLAFVINQGFFQSARAGAGFRRFRIGRSGDELQVMRFDDLTALAPFEASARAGVMVLKKGERTRYPVPYTVWSRGKGTPRGPAVRSLVSGAGLSHVDKLARPVTPGRRFSPWAVFDHDDVASDGPDQERATYTARTGAYSGGANGVFWIHVLSNDGEAAEIRNMNQCGKRKVAKTTATVETGLIYPLLRWRDVARWRAIPRQHIILVQEPGCRKPLPEAFLRRSFPRTHSYLKSFENVLLSRKSKVIRDLMDRAAFYAMFGIGEYTLSPWKVVWRRMVRELTAAVVGQAGVGGEAKPVVPQETLTFIPCSSEAEAHYLCAVLNSPQATAKARSFAVGGGKSFGTAGMLSYFAIQRYDPANGVHAALAGLSSSAHETAAGGGAVAGLGERIAELLSAHRILT